MGMAQRNAQVLQSKAMAMTVTAKHADLRPQLQQWADAGRPLHRIETQRGHSPRTDLPAEETDAILGTLVFVASANIASLSALAGPQIGFRETDGGHWTACHEPNEAFALASAIVGSEEASGVALLQAIFDPKAPCASLLQKAEALAAIGKPGVILTDHCTAMAWVHSGVSEVVEELGEIRTPWGNEPVWCAR